MRRRRSRPLQQAPLTHQRKPTHPDRPRRPVTQPHRQRTPQGSPPKRARTPPRASFAYQRTRHCPAYRT
jgi:hypothetical protein